MIEFLKFVVSRYSGFVSHLAAFLAGLSLLVSLPVGVVLLSVAVVFGNLSAWYRRTVNG